MIFPRASPKARLRARPLPRRSSEWRSRTRGSDAATSRTKPGVPSVDPSSAMMSSNAEVTCPRASRDLGMAVSRAARSLKTGMTMETSISPMGDRSPDLPRDLGSRNDGALHGAFGVIGPGEHAREEEPLLLVGRHEPPVSRGIHRPCEGLDGHPVPPDSLRRHAEAAAEMLHHPPGEGGIHGALEVGGE